MYAAHVIHALVLLPALPPLLQLRLASGHPRAIVVAAEQPRIAVLVSGARLISVATHAYAGVPVAVAALALIVLEALPSILEVSLQQVILVDAFDLGSLAVDRRLARIRHDLICLIRIHSGALHPHVGIGREEVAHLVRVVIARAQFDGRRRQRRVVIQAQVVRLHVVIVEHALHLGASLLYICLCCHEPCHYRN